MPYEDDYKMWLEKMLIEMNPDWVCDEMSNNEFTHNWCHQYCGEEDAYITPKCLHMFYHHIVRADRKTENSSEKPNNCEPRTENLFTDKYGDVWEWRGDAWHCISGEDEPQTDTEIAKAIVHKMIDDAVIAEDAYPDLRQKMHDAVDEYEPQTDCAWK